MENGAGLGADNICLNFIRKRTVFGKLSGGHHGQSPEDVKDTTMLFRVARYAV